MAPKVASVAAPKAEGILAACGCDLPPLGKARSDEQPSIPLLKRKRFWVKTAPSQPKCLEYITKYRRYRNFKDGDVEHAMDFLQHTDGSTRDEMLIRLLYHVHPRTVNDNRYLPDCMQLNAVVMALYKAGATVSEAQMPGLPSSPAILREAERLAASLLVDHRGWERLENFKVARMVRNQYAAEVVREAFELLTENGIVDVEAQQ